MAQKTAFITGASAGIGRATAIALAGAGYQLILLARRASALKELALQLSSTNTHLMVCDINDHETVAQQLYNLPEQFRDIDVLVNNAGLALGLDTADKIDWQDWRTMIDTNCLSLAFMTRQILPSMVERNQGHIINIGSTAGSFSYQGGNVYGASKAFVEHFSMSLLSDFLGTNLRVSCVIPGLIGGTEFSNVRFHGDDQRADKVYENLTPLTAEDIAETVRWIVEQPAHVNVNRIEVMPVCQAPIGLGYA